MNKFLKIMLLTIFFIIGFKRAEAGQNIPFINRVFLTYDANITSYNKIVLKKVIRKADDFDDSAKANMFSYYASIGVMNPTKKYYDLVVNCVDEKNNIIFRKTIQQEFSEANEERIAGDVLRTSLIVLPLKIKGKGGLPEQIKPFVKGRYYFVKLYFENKLLSIESFGHEIEH